MKTKNKRRVLRLERLEPRQMLAIFNFQVSLSPPTTATVGQATTASAIITVPPGNKNDTFTAVVTWQQGNPPVSGGVTYTDDPANITGSQSQIDPNNPGQTLQSAPRVTSTYTPTIAGAWTITVTVADENVTDPSTGNYQTATDTGTFAAANKTTIGSNTTLSNSNLPDATTNVFVTNGASLDLGGSSVPMNGLDLNNGTVTDSVGGGSVIATFYTVENGSISANLAGGSLTCTGGADGTGTVVISGTNTYVDTDVEGGTLRLGSSAALGDPTGSLTINNGALDLNGQQIVTVGSLAGGSGTISNSNAQASVLTVNQAINTVYVGSIQDGNGPVGLTMSGPGMLTLAPSVANTFSGGIVVNNGTLVATSSSALPYGSGLTVGAEGTVVFGASGLVASPADPWQDAASASNPPTTTAATQSPTSPPGTTWLQKTGAANDAAVQALAGVLDPSNQTHSSGVMRQASGLYVEVVFSVLMPASGASTASTGDLVDAALAQAFESTNMTITPNANPGGDTYSNPINNRMIAIDNALLQFLECNDVTFNGA